MALIDLNSAPSGEDTPWLDSVAGHEFEGRYRTAERAGRERAEHRAEQNRLREVAAVSTVADVPVEPKLGGGPMLLGPAPENPAPRKRYRLEVEEARRQAALGSPTTRRYRRGEG